MISISDFVNKMNEKSLYFTSIFKQVSQKKVFKVEGNMKNFAIRYIRMVIRIRKFGKEIDRIFNGRVLEHSNGIGIQNSICMIETKIP